MVSALTSGSSSPDSSPGQGHCVDILLTQCLSPPRCIKLIGTSKFTVGGNPAMD